MTTRGTHWCGQAQHTGDGRTTIYVIIYNIRNHAVVPSMWGSLRLTPIIIRQNAGHCGVSMSDLASYGRAMSFVIATSYTCIPTN